MATSAAVRTEDDGAVRSIVLCRPDEYNTITPQLRDELAAAVDAADADDSVRVMLLRAEGRAFCAGFGLEWSTRFQAEEESARRAWDSVEDLRFMGEYQAAFSKLWYARKPVVAAIQGWCIGGAMDLVLCADLIVAAESASFGYPPVRVWGVPNAALWVRRMGLERAKRYLFTGDEIPAPEALRLGLVLEMVPDDELGARAAALAGRIALLPSNQLQMLKLLCNETAEGLSPKTSLTLAMLFDGVARHTQEGLDFVARAREAGFRQAVRDRDDPFGDYGSRPRP